MKKYVFPIIYSLVIMLIGGLLTTLLYYFNITNDKINKIILYLIGITAMFIGSCLFYNLLCCNNLYVISNIKS